MNYHHLSIEERSCIRKYYVDGMSYREIARLVGRNVSTVSREIRRNCTHKPEKMPIGSTSLSFCFWISKYLTEPGERCIL